MKMTVTCPTVTTENRYCVGQYLRGYQFTVNHHDPIQMNSVQALRREVREYNKSRPADSPRKRVRVRGRLGPNNPHRDLYRRGGPLYRWSSQDYKLEHSVRADVYVHDDYSGLY